MWDIDVSIQTRKVMQFHSVRSFLWILPIAVLLTAGCDSPGESARMSEAPFPGGEIVDLTHSFNDSTVYWPTAAGFTLTTDAEGMTDGGYYYSAYSFSSAEHGGTHLDAPVHFAEGRHTADEIELERLIAPAVLIDVSDRALEDPDYLISVDDVAAWEEAHGALPDGGIVLFRTGFGRYWPDREAYMGTAERGAEAVQNLHFPGLDPTLAEWLVANRSVGAVGIDTPSIDTGQSTLFEAHRHLFEANIPAFENVANLDRLPTGGFAVIALPMKIEGGSGGPLRIVAVL